MKALLFTISLFLTASLLSAQSSFRSGIFLHHSTGNYIWGPNPGGTSTTTIPAQINLYNSAHGLSGANAVTMNEEWWSPGDNEWATQHEFFEGNTAFTDINSYLASNKIVVVKSCFPSSALESIGVATDTLNPTYKSIYNYKWHWRHIIKVMAKHPDRFFAIWTNAPLEVSSTDAAAAAFSKSFCKWAKDTLAKGLDPICGAFPANVYVFDFFSKLTDANGYLQNQYRTSQGDSHPNGLATDLVAPQFVNEIFNAAIAYEQVVTTISNVNQPVSGVKIFPNPATNMITIEFINPTTRATVTITNLNGQQVYSKTIGTQGIDLSGFSKGVYFVQVLDGKAVETKRIVVQ